MKTEKYFFVGCHGFCTFEMYKFLQMVNYNWEYLNVDINAPSSGAMSQVVDNFTPEGELFGTNRLTIFQDMVVIHNHYATSKPLEKQQHIDNCQAVIDIIQMVGGFNGYFNPPGNAAKVPFGNSIMVANFTCSQPHGLSFGNGSELYMNHAFLQHGQLEALANRYPDQLECAAREIMALDKDVVLGGYSRADNKLFGAGKSNLDPASPMQQNCIAAIFAPHILGNSQEAFILDNLVKYLNCLYPTTIRPKALEKVNYSADLVNKVYEARDIILSDIQSPLSLRKLSLAVGTNENYLKAAFKNEFGITVYAYLFECRMRLARQLLLDTSLPVEQIATIVGYTDPAGFYAPFKRRFHTTPTRYRTLRLYTEWE